jgi:hypothetical protein
MLENIRTAGGRNLRPGGALRAQLLRFSKRRNWLSVAAKELTGVFTEAN